MWFPRKRETFKDMQKSIGVPFTVYPDGKEFKHETTAPVKYLGEHAGCFKHYYRVLEDLCKSDAEYVAVMSDDVLYAPKWCETAISAMGEDVGFVACYTPEGLRKRHNWSKGIQEIKGGWASSWGGAYLMKRDVAKKVLNHPYFINHRDNYAKNQQIDHALPNCIHLMGLKQLFLVPSLTDHIGLTSTIGHVHTHREKGAGW